MSLFSLQGVSLTVGGTSILRDINLDLGDPQGDGRGITAIVGPSGSGKSSLLRLLNRLEVPTAGTIRYRNQALADMDPQALRVKVGMVFQRPTVFDGTSLENLQVADSSLGESEGRKLLERVGLDAGLLDREASDLSGGEAQRLCLARTLATGPDVVLLDEPTSALDAEAVQTIERLAIDLANDGVQQIWVSHDVDQVNRLADWVVELAEGEVVSSASRTARGHGEARGHEDERG